MFILIFILIALIIVVPLLILAICGSDVCFRELDEINDMMINKDYESLYHKYNDKYSQKKSNSANKK